MIFLVGAPGSGAGTLLEALSVAHGVTVADGAALDAVTAEVRDERDSDRLTAADAARLREPLGAALPEDAIVAGGTLALQVPLLAAIFPDAKFVLVVREPSEALPTALDAGEPAPRIPGWRALEAEPAEIAAAERWSTITITLLDDLSALLPERSSVADHARLRADPRGELRRLCVVLGLHYDQALLGPFEDERRAQRPPRAVAGLERTARAAARAADVVAPAGPVRSRYAVPDSPLDSRSTPSFPQRLRELGSSLLISTYQANKLVCARERSGTLNTHFRDFDKPMGVAVAPGQICLGTRTEIFELRDMPDVAPKLDPPGTHDAAYLPRNRHVTGDIAVHELAFAGGELWVVATQFSCLATIDARHSFVPRWTPSFISELAPGDRCHLNGLAVVDDAVRYATALGRTDVAGGWRERKADGGVLLEVPSSEVVASGLSMPHSPRWHDGRLWVLESGRGALCTIDLDTGRAETVVELPGFTRGLAMAGGLAFIGLSQIRESSTFGDLPITRRLDERMSGVWVVDLARGAIDGFLRFDDLVQEVFDVALLPGARWPEIAEPASSAVALSFELP
jgi:uncharacterized protein (TIGR03032 family)